MRPILVFPCCVVLACTAGLLGLARGAVLRTATETVVVKDSGGGVSWSLATVSLDGRRIAFERRVGDKAQVIVDGRAGKVYDSIGCKPFNFTAQGIVFSPDSRVVAYGARVGDKAVMVVGGKEGGKYSALVGPLFSPDSSWIAYVGELSNRKKVLVVDGKAGPEYDDIYCYSDHRSVVFSPDSRRICYVAKAGTKDIVVVGGKVMGTYDRVPQPAHFSPDSKRLAYWAVRGSRYFAIVDGRPLPSYDGAGAVWFSPDGQRIAYRAYEKAGKRRLSFMVVDGEIGKKYHGVRLFTFGPRGRRFAYRAFVRDGKQISHVMVVDGQEGKFHRNVYPFHPPVFSPDGRRVAYMADDGQGWFAVVDGKAGKTYAKADVLGSRLVPVFSADSRHVAYVAPTPRKGFRVVLDGKEGKRHLAWILGRVPMFSPDGKRMAYGVRERRKRFLVVDGREGKRYDSIWWVRDFLIGKATREIGAAEVKSVFSPDSQHVIYAARDGGKAFVVVDDSEGKKYDAILLGLNGIVFDSARSFHYLARRGKDVLLVEETLGKAPVQDKK